MNKHYACSDLHGMWELWEQISVYCDETDVIYFLGDALDRGSHGIRLMKDLLLDKRVKYIMGNHEDMLIKAFYTKDFSLVKANGGEDTIKDFYKLPKKERNYIITELEKLPKEIEYYNFNSIRIVLNHSGYNSENPHSNTMLYDPYFWDREHIYFDWKGDNNTIIIHGHTPTPYLTRALNTIEGITGYHYEEPETIEEVAVVRYCGNHKIDIDLGSFYTKRAALLDLDTLETKYFAID